jgi:hypothetical protein
LEVRGCVYPAVGLPGAGGGQGGAEAAIYRGGDGGSLQRTSEAISKLILRRQACIIAKKAKKLNSKCSARDWDRIRILEEIPRCGIQMSALT